MHFRISRDVKDSVEYQMIGFGKHSYNAKKKVSKDENYKGEDYRLKRRKK